LTPNVPVAGPAIVEERESTTVIAPGDQLHADENGNLRIEIGVATASTAEVER
jgi:N-methylhydantoinase A/oxoprolinase/acetone carboxylase beta subunit